MVLKFFHGLSNEGFHRLAYTERGTPNPKRAVICMHGLTRNKSDFDFLAEDLSKDFHVVALDVVGRGQSDCFKDPQNYRYEQYMSDANALIARLDVEEIYWIGTSMGGLIGMIMASLPNSPIKKLILNDVGPLIPKAAVDRIKQYASIKLTFKNFEEGAALLRQVYAPFGKLTEDHWQHLLKNSIVQEPQGTYTLAYDPSSARYVEDDNNPGPIKTIEDKEGNILFWSFWDKITCPVLVINGEFSDILPKTLLEEMQKRGPIFDRYEVKEAGHAPALMDPLQRDTIYQWLLKN